MKKVTKEVLKSIANSLMFDMSSDEYDYLVTEFDTLLQQINFINRVENVDEAEPMIFPFDVTNDYLRDDIAGKPLSVDNVLKNAPDVSDSQIRVPKVIK